MSMEEGKQTILKDWEYVRNAIILAKSGEMKVSYNKSNDQEDSPIVGICVDLELVFDKPITQDKEGN